MKNLWPYFLKGPSDAVAFFLLSEETNFPDLFTIIAKLYTFRMIYWQNHIKVESEAKYSRTNKACSTKQGADRMRKKFDASARNQNVIGNSFMVSFGYFFLLKSD